MNKKNVKIATILNILNGYNICFEATYKYYMCTKYQDMKGCNLKMTAILDFSKT